MPYLKLDRILPGLLGWIPYSTGVTLRRIGYRLVFHELGELSNIEPSVYLIGASRISLGKQVNLRSGVTLEMLDHQSHLIIGTGVTLDLGVSIKAHSGSGAIEIGDHTYIGPYTCLSGKDIKIGMNCLIASHSSIYASNHIFTDPTQLINQQGHTYKGIVIEDDCWLGTGVKVLDGVTIRRGSIIGAGSVVTKDVPSYSIAAGIPAKVIDYRTQFASPQISISHQDN
jgi:acetyltransferase-like isoleucine patch superfamily enzyme